MLVEEVLLVMGLRLLSVVTTESEISESDEDVESGRDEHTHKNKMFRLTKTNTSCTGWN
jgi:hypothetical protein